MPIMKSLYNSSRLGLGLLTLVLLSTPSVFSQSINRMVQWPETIITAVNSTGSGYSPELEKIDALEIIDIAVGGKSITIGQFFAGDDEWLKNSKTLSSDCQTVENGLLVV